MIQELRRLRYYFIDLPLWSYGYRSRALEQRLYKDFEPEIPSIRNGYEVLSRYVNRSVTESEIGDVLQKAFWVKVVRESDAYTSQRMSGKHLNRYFQFEGMDHLKAASSEKRPVIILTGHIGSFFIPAIAFYHLGFEVYPIARSVDTSPATPRSTRLYLALNYRLLERQFSAKYILTDFSGKIDRTIVTVSKNHGMFWVALDFPWRLYQYRHLPVRLFGQPATLPSGIIRWGIKKNALFLTGWNSVEADAQGFYRLLTIDNPIEQETDAQAILQAYADRLSEYVIKKPWQWMALPVIQHFEERCSKNMGRNSPVQGTVKPAGPLNESLDKVFK